MFQTSRRMALASVGLTIVACALAAGCIDLPLATATKTLTEEFTTGDAPQIVVETFNGPIDVSPGKSGEVIVEVTKRASGIDQSAAEANLDNVEVSMVQKDNRIHVAAKRIGSEGNCGAAVVISVPPKSRVDLKTSNGAIVCEEIVGGVDATSSNGKLAIVECGGRIELATSNGGIEIDARDAEVDARTSNGRIELRGTLAKGDHRLKSSNGKIKLVLPPDSQFKLKASTSNSRIENDFTLADAQRERRTSIEGTVGDKPAFSITATTSNGGIEIRKADKDD